MARACGSYPQCRWFKSDYRYHRSSNRRSNSGPMVKRLRHRPFTAVTRVRFPFGSPLYGRIAQLVRAPASHAGGQRFESVYAHQLRTVHTSVWAVLNLCVITEPMPLPPRKAVRPFMSSSQREMRRSKRFESVYAHQIKAVHSSEWAVLFYVRRWTPCRLIKRKHEQDNAPK